MGQLIGTLVIIAWMFVASFVVLFILNLIMPLRVSEDEELEGMDIHECGMLAYPEFGPASQASDPYQDSDSTSSTTRSSRVSSPAAAG
ncbi:Ammonia permease [Nitrincola nitratireducens]|uniref:Ammonia permease n=1 Tax=Nitrincola nitratireducens TaxID=1229521 RepID=W9V6I2_9GAMM|nr:Ammonia permease [Nitrincola nitratireducens]